MAEGEAASVGRFVFDTAFGAVTGGIPGLKIPGITAGKGNFNAIYKQMVTKFKQGQIANVGAKTASKMFAGRAVDKALVPGTAAGAIAGVGADAIGMNNDSRANTLGNGNDAAQGMPQLGELNVP